MPTFTHGSNFFVELDGMGELAIMEHTPVTHEINKVEHKRQLKDGKYVLEYLPGTPKVGEVTLTFALRKDTVKLIKWFAETARGLPTIHKSGAIVILDPSGKEEIERHSLHRCFPTKIEFSSLKAGDTNPVTVKLTLAHHGTEEALSKLGQTILS